MKNLIITLFLFSTIFGGYQGYQNRINSVALGVLEDNKGKTYVKKMVAQQVGREQKAGGVVKAAQSEKIAGEETGGPVYFTGVGEDTLHQGVSTQSAIKRTIQKYFGDDAEVAIMIANCESRLNPQAVGDRQLNPPSFGLFQIRAFDGRAPVEELLTVEGNCKEAKRIFDAEGFTPWSCYYKI
jgi:hypothetical protein